MKMEDGSRPIPPAAFLELVRTVTSSSLKALAPALRSDRLRALVSISARLNSFVAHKMTMMTMMKVRSLAYCVQLATAINGVCV